ncbi:hypothetical protein TNCV_1783741 [Trichonephila clavipes]|nr:hypothetical protein TNCV_1783741 [Trichonephila clavipes]
MTKFDSSVQTFKVAPGIGCLKRVASANAVLAAANEFSTSSVHSRRVSGFLEGGGKRDRAIGIKKKINVGFMITNEKTTEVESKSYVAAAPARSSFPGMNRAEYISLPLWQIYYDTVAV